MSDGDTATTERPKLTRSGEDTATTDRPKLIRSTSAFFERSSSILTRSKGFRRLSKWAFEVCDKDGTGQVGKHELYAGILLVHLYLAKYAGAAACYPPSREVVDAMFDHVDADQSGTIDEDEFLSIMMVCCVDITSRIVVYYSIIILLVPVVARYSVKGLLSLDEFMGWDVSKREVKFFNFVEKVLTWNKLAEKCISFSLFFFVIPLIFDEIDNSSKRGAQISSMEQQQQQQQQEEEEQDGEKKKED